MITITTPNTEKLYFNAEPIDNVVSRLEFYAPKEGKTIQVALYFYENLAAFEAGEQNINIQGVSDFGGSAKYYNLALGTDPETYLEQTIQVAHDKVKVWLDSLGYLATIVL